MCFMGVVGNFRMIDDTTTYHLEVGMNHHINLTLYFEHWA